MTLQYYSEWRVEQLGADTTALAIDKIFSAVLAENEAAWVETIREGVKPF